MRVEAPPLFATFIVVAGITTVGITMAVKASRDKPRAIEQFARLLAPPAFDERFSEWTTVFPITKKQDRLPPIVAAEPPAAVAVVMATARTDVPQTVAPTVSGGRHRNICERHHMRKVKHGKYGWRCRK
jgi:hypothetical protein